MNQPVDLAFHDEIAVVTLNSPPLNIFDVEMRDELIGAVSGVSDVPSIKAMVLRAEGKHFSAGADLSEFGSAESIFEGRRIRWDRDPWAALSDLRVPTIAALHGTTLGSGLEMALLCDIRLASPDTLVGLPETKLGMLPAAGGTQSLTKTIGTRDATPIVARANTMTATEAAARSLIHRIEQDVDSAAFAVAGRLALLDPDLLSAARRALRAAQDLPLDAGIAVENKLMELLRMHRQPHA